MDEGAAKADFPGSGPSNSLSAVATNQVSSINGLLFAISWGVSFFLIPRGFQPQTFIVCQGIAAGIVHGMIAVLVNTIASSLNRRRCRHNLCYFAVHFETGPDLVIDYHTLHDSLKVAGALVASKEGGTQLCLVCLELLRGSEEIHRYRIFHESERIKLAKALRAVAGMISTGPWPIVR